MVLLAFGIWIATRPGSAPVADGRDATASVDGARPDGASPEQEGIVEPLDPTTLESEHAPHDAHEPTAATPRVRVRGLVVRERTGEPIAGARITVLSRAAMTIGGSRSVHDVEHPPTLDDVRVIELISLVDGTFEWEGPASPPTEGEYGFGARAAGFGARCGSFPAVISADAIARIELRPEAIIRGRVVREDGRPIPGTRVDVRLESGREVDAWWRDRQGLFTRTGAEGEYELREIDVGSPGGTMAVEFRAFTGRVSRTESSPIALESGAIREVDWTPADSDGEPRRVSTLPGHVRERNGTPIAGARIEFMQRVPVAKGRAGYTSTAFAKSDSAGAFTLRSSPSSVASETFLVRVGAVGFVTVSLQYRGEERGPLEVSLERALPQEGVVTQSDGTPAPGVWVAFFLTGERVDAETNRKPPPVEQVQTDRDGRFRARSLADAPYDVIVTGDLPKRTFSAVPRQPLMRIVLESGTGEESDR